MKKYEILKYLLIFTLIFSFLACDDTIDNEFDEAVELRSLPWQASVKMDVAAVEDKEVFIWLTNVVTLEQYWGNETVELEMTFSSGIPTENYTKIDFYLTAEEVDGYNVTDPFDTEGRFLKTISELPEDGEFSLHINGNDAYELFKSDFLNSRSEVPLLDGDLFEIHWILTNNDRSTYNSKDYVGGDTRFGFATLHKEKKPPSWEGTFEYECIYVSDGGLNYGGVEVGDTGEITIVETTGTLELNKLFDVDDLSFGYYYGGPGALSLNFNTGKTAVIDDS